MANFGSKIGSALHEEHRSTLMALDALESMVGAKTPPALNDRLRGQMGEIARAMEADVTRHFGFEEANLFPLLQQAGATFMVNMLVNEHGSIRPLAQSIQATIEHALAEGSFEASHWPQFRETVRDFIDTETFHIQKEEMGLLSALAQLLTPAQDEALAQAYEAL